VKTHGERIYQVFGKETLDQLVPLAAALRWSEWGSRSRRRGRRNYKMKITRRRCR